MSLTVINNFGSAFGTSARRWLLVSLMALTLIGVQVLQASPHHDDLVQHHAGHDVDCALCHLHFGDDSVVSHPLLVAVARQVQVVRGLVVPVYSSRNPSPYQGRAPPSPVL